MPTQHYHAAQAQLGRGGRRLPAVIRLLAGGRDDHIGPLGQHVGHCELELAGFVATGGQAGLVISFDEQTRRIAQRGTQAWHFLQWRRQLSQ
jgi:hypothetical protein